jgi:hypothetical protein
MDRRGVAVALLVFWTGGCSGSLDRAAVSEAFERPAHRLPCPAVQQILDADMSPEARMKALEPFLDIGHHQAEVEQVLGSANNLFGNAGFLTVYYGEFCKSGLNVTYYPDGEVCTIVYRTGEGIRVCMRSDDPITWPKTTDGKNAVLRQKNKK